MRNLIKALQIFLKYGNEQCPVSCDHGVLFINGITESQVSKEDLDKLLKLGFTWDNMYSCFISLKYGTP